ncbi:hypothetical protein H0266_07725 [Halobacillus locisalis]|uniref:Uncharacterized protein n=1 Tax=Halobacillus locisalis TaxID=220753 RepID=A0A838CSI2_9BACI|nr:hypothetical protein [Halobacillus locisalis]MBA2174779.1 hypothetical protein [Halobacillus locisalis]
MKKTLRHSSFFLLSLAIILIGFLKMNPPLAYGSIGTTSDKHAVVVAVGNKHVVGSIHFTEVWINGMEAPTKIKVQVSDSNTGFVMSDLVTAANDHVKLEDYHSFKLLPNSSPSPSEKPPYQQPIYGLSISEDVPIERIDVSYTYLGLTFEETIQL